MARKRVYEVARAHGLSSRELLARLRAADIAVTTASSSVDEDEAAELLAQEPGAELAAEGPARRIREYLDEHGSTTVPLHNLLTTWRLEVLTRARCQAIIQELAATGVRVDPPLDPGLDEAEHVTLSVDAPEAPSAAEPVAAEPEDPAPLRLPRPKRGDDARGPGLLERARLQIELRRLRRRYDLELRDFGGLVFETRRLELDRSKLLDERQAQLRAISAQLADVEEQLGASKSGAMCPNCNFYAGDTRVCLACGHAFGPRAPGRSYERMSKPVVAVGVVLLTGAWLFGGLRGGDEHATPQRAAAVAPPRAPKPPPYRSLVAHVKGPAITVFRSPDGPPRARLANPNDDGAPLVFLVKHIKGGWAKVYLPIRPNGSFGWIRLSKVSLAGHSYRLVVNLRRHRLTAYRRDRVLMRAPIGTGRAVTPTPTGTYYITELLRQPDPSGIYGPYAFGLSVHSNVLNEFAGADGILGLHGTDFPQGIGTNVSHGCIRVENRVITRLAKTLPVGTPVQITRA